MNGQRTYWWLPNKDDIEDERHRALSLIQETAEIEQRQSSWHELNLWNATLFTNRELASFKWGQVNAERELWPTNLRTENLIESIGSTMHSKASSSPLRPSLTPHGNNWEVERAVREVDDLVFSTWMVSKSEDACSRSYLDAFQSGLGAITGSYDADTDTLSIEPVFYDEVIIDNRECLGRQKPRTVRRRRVVPISMVETKYQRRLEDFKKQYVEYRDIGDGWCVLVEAWRLPNQFGVGGRHSIAAGGTLLLDEEWEHDDYPWRFFHWEDITDGFFTKSGVEQLVPFQVKHNTLNDTIELVQDIVCRPRILHHVGSQIDVSQWDNEAGRILGYAGEKPEPFQWATNLMDLYNERERNVARAHSHMGMSEMSVGADLPQGVRLDSSAGVREARNMEDARHLRRWIRYEDHRLEVAKMTMFILSISNAGNFSASFSYSGKVTKKSSIKFKEALKTLKKNCYSWTLQAVPLSTMSPAARRETIRDWSSRGLIDDSEARRMEDNPNLERLEDLEMSSYEDITLFHIPELESGRYVAPTELTNLTFGIKRVTQNYHRLRRMEDVPEGILANHLKWITSAVAIQQTAAFANTPTPFAPTQGMPGTNATTLPPSVSTAQ